MTHRGRIPTRACCATSSTASSTAPDIRSTRGHGSRNDVPECGLARTTARSGSRAPRPAPYSSRHRASTATSSRARASACGAPRKRRDRQRRAPRSDGELLATTKLTTSNLRNSIVDRSAAHVEQHRRAGHVHHHAGGRSGHRCRLRRSIPRAVRSRRVTGLGASTLDGDSSCSSCRTATSSTRSSSTVSTSRRASTELLLNGKAPRTTTAYRTLVEVAVSDLALARMDISELELRAGALAARMQIRTRPPRASSKVIRTASKCSSPDFNRFPRTAGTRTSRPSRVTASIRRQLRNAQVMRIVYARRIRSRGRQVADLIARCRRARCSASAKAAARSRSKRSPTTCKTPARSRAACPITAASSAPRRRSIRPQPPTRDTLLPLDAINDALVAIDEAAAAAAAIRAATSATT